VLCGDVTSCAECGEIDPLTGKWTATSDSPFGNWACENCPDAGGAIDPYASRIIELYMLQKGGYPFGPDDIEISDRMILGAVEISLRRREIANLLQSILGRGENTI